MPAHHAFVSAPAFIEDCLLDEEFDIFEAAPYDNAAGLAKDLLPADEESWDEEMEFA